MSQHHIDVRYVAALARLELTEQEAATFQPQMDAILGFVESLSRLDPAANADPQPPIFGHMRDDEPHESLPATGLLANAPDQAQNQIRVPKVIADA